MFARLKIRRSAIVLFWLLTLLISVGTQAQMTCAMVYGSDQPVGATYVLNGNWIETPTPPVSLEEFAPSSSSAWYTELAFAGKLLSQTDPSLSQRNLLVERGGLCGPTCLLNVTTANLRRQGKTYTQAERAEIIKSLIEIYNRATGMDGRAGTTLPELLKSATSYFGDWFRYSILKKQQMNPSDLTSLLNRQDGIFLITVRFLTANGKAHDQHAMTLLAIDTSKQLLVIGDPNFPMAVSHHFYTVDNNGFIHFETLPLYGKPSHEVAIIEAAFLTIKPMGRAEEIPVNHAEPIGPVAPFLGGYRPGRDETEANPDIPSAYRIPRGQQRIMDEDEKNAPVLDFPRRVPRGALLIH